MTATIAPAIVRQVSHLAMLAIPEARLPEMALELQKVLDLVAVLETVDVSGVAPLLHPHEELLAPRADGVVPSLTPDEALANAPVRGESYFLTPRVVG